MLAALDASSSCQIRKGYDNPVSFILAGFLLSLLRPDPWGSEHLIHRERPVATQHSLRNCVDHLAALSHAYDFDVNLACYTPYPPVKGQRLDNLSFFGALAFLQLLRFLSHA